MKNPTFGKKCSFFEVLIWTPNFAAITKLLTKNILLGVPVYFYGSEKKFEVTNFF